MIAPYSSNQENNNKKKKNRSKLMNSNEQEKKFHINKLKQLLVIITLRHLNDQVQPIFLKF